jgi:hypothetical protein
MHVRFGSLALLLLAGLAAVDGSAQVNDAADGQNSPAASVGQLAQTPSTPDGTSSTPAAPAAKPGFTLAKVDFSGSADVYYSINNNHPTGGFNQLYNFNDKADQFDLNMAKLSASLDPEPVGFRFDLGLGRVFDNLYPYGNPDPGIFRYVEQAYVSLKPKQLNGFEADFGEFTTSAGAEVIETKDNWNYSRSVLFSWAVPYYHFGIRTSMPIGKGWNVGVQVVNGWNTIVNDYGKNMQTVGVTAAWTRKKYTWSNNYYTGPNPAATINKGNRNLYDTTLLLTPNDKLNVYINFDDAEQARIAGGTDHYRGAAAAARWQINKYFAFSPRLEIFGDPTGYSTGTAQRLREITLTGECKIYHDVLTRFEYRRDASNVPFFQHGDELNASRGQSTVVLGLIAYFDTHEK